MKIRHSTARFAAILLIVAATICAKSSSAEEVGLPNAIDELSRLKEIWTAWKTTAKSIDVTGFRFYGRLPHPAEQVSRDDILTVIQTTVPALVATNRLTLDVPSLYSTTTAIFGSDTANAPDPNGRLSVWSKESFIRDSDNARFDTMLGGVTRAYVRRGATEEHYSSGTRQASIYTSTSTTKIPDVNDIMYIPDFLSVTEPWTINNTEEHNIKQLVANRAKGSVSIEYDRTSGFVKSYIHRGIDDAIRSECLQFQPVVTPNGIPVPTIIAKVKYNQSQKVFAYLDLFITTEVELGSNIDSRRFDMSVPAGTNIVQFGDYGTHIPEAKGGARPAMAFAKKAVDDAEGFTRTAEFKSASQLSITTKRITPGPASTWRLWLIGANIAILLVVVCGLAIRRGSRKDA